jgi:hypothetical protein
MVNNSLLIALLAIAFLGFISYFVYLSKPKDVKEEDFPENEPNDIDETPQEGEVLQVSTEDTHPTITVEVIEKVNDNEAKPKTRKKYSRKSNSKKNKNSKKHND